MKVKSKSLTVILPRKLKFGFLKTFKIHKNNKYEICKKYNKGIII